MLLDSTHKRWFWATVIIAFLALVAYFFFQRQTPGGLTGGSTVGLWYGAIGSALMIYAGLLAAHRKVPSWWWIGRRTTWLRGHIWLGLLSALFLLCHSGFHWGGPLELALWLVTIGVLATGIFGLFVQGLLPRMMTSRIPCESPYEQIPHLCQVMRRKADALVESVCGPQGTEVDIQGTIDAARAAGDGRVQLRAFYEENVRPFLAAEAPRSSPLFNPLQAEARFAKLRNLTSLADAREPLGQLATLCEERRLLSEQERIHFWLHSWLILHVPLSVALLVLGVVHVVTALYY